MDNTYIHISVVRAVVHPYIHISTRSQQMASSYTRFSPSMEMSRLTRDGTAEPVSRDQTLRDVRGQQENFHFPCSADHEQDWQHHPVDPFSAICDDHTYALTTYYV